MSDEASTLVPVRALGVTGMVIDLSGDTETMLRQADELNQARAEIQAAKAAIVEVIADRADRSNARKLGDGKYIGKVNAPFETEWDAEELDTRLFALGQLGVIDESVRETVITTTIEYGVRAREVNKLRKHPDPRVREAISACERIVPARRWLSVSVVGHQS